MYRYINAYSRHYIDPYITKSKQKIMREVKFWKHTFKQT